MLTSYSLILRSLKQKIILHLDQKPRISIRATDHNLGIQPRVVAYDLQVTEAGFRRLSMLPSWPGVCLPIRPKIRQPRLKNQTPAQSTILTVKSCSRSFRYSQALFKSPLTCSSSINYVTISFSLRLRHVQKSDLLNRNISVENRYNVQMCDVIIG